VKKRAEEICFIIENDHNFEESKGKCKLHFCFLARFKSYCVIQATPDKTETMKNEMEKQNVQCAYSAIRMAFSGAVILLGVLVILGSEFKYRCIFRKNILNTHFFLSSILQ